MRKCGNCFRFKEDWADAEAKGLKSRESAFGIIDSRKPRKGVACICTSVHKKDEPHANDKGCKRHQYRWLWNLRHWWRWDFQYTLKRWFDIHIRCPIGRLRKPVPIKWVDSFDYVRNKIIPESEPQCPHCGEMAYRYSECVFCGQRFVQDEKTRMAAEPPKEEVDDCFMCGGKGTLKGHRAKLNGHFHGKCEQCGAVIIE